MSLLTLLAIVMAATQPSAPQPSQVVRLWQQDAPGARGADDDDVPTIALFPASPRSATGAAVIVCPGGGYSGLAAHEGAPVAQWLNSLGITAFVLKYRLGPKYHHPTQLHDVQRAVRLVRARSGEWQLDAKRVGIVGFSAGGHLASTAATHFDDAPPDPPDSIDRMSCRPDLVLLIYPVITFADPSVHKHSRLNLLGENPDPQLLDLLSNDRRVTDNTPPCFLVHGADDATVPVENSQLFFAACRKHHVPVEMHLFEHGPHGFGLGGDDPILSTWPTLAAKWLKQHDFAR